LAGARPITPSVDGIAGAKPEEQGQDSKPAHSSLIKPAEQRFAHEHDRIPGQSVPGAPASVRDPRTSGTNQLALMY
jgi:hypothetical protein